MKCNDIETTSHRHPLRRRLFNTSAALLLVCVTKPALASQFNNAIAATEERFKGEAFQAEQYRQGGRTFFEVKVLAGARVVEAEYNVANKQFQDVDEIRKPRLVARIGRSLARATLTLAEASQIAATSIGSGEVLEAKLRRNGKRYVVEVANNQEAFKVVLNARDGHVLRIRAD